jgi:hypothetical protein
MDSTLTVYERRMMSSAMLKPAGLSQSELCKRNGRSVPAITPVEPNTECDHQDKFGLEISQ